MGLHDDRVLPSDDDVDQVLPAGNDGWWPRDGLHASPEAAQGPPR
jgi:hypothetical protein